MNHNSNTLIEDYKSDDNEPTTPEQTYEFPWEQVFANLDGEPESGVPERDYKAMGQALKRIFDHVLDVDLTRPNLPRAVGRRFLMLAWVMDPKRFKGASLRTFAKSLGSSVAHLSVIAAETSRKMGIANRFQAHDWRKAA